MCECVDAFVEGGSGWGRDDDVDRMWVKGFRSIFCGTSPRHAMICVSRVEWAMAMEEEEEQPQTMHRILACIACVCVCVLSI